MATSPLFNPRTSPLNITRPTNMAAAAFAPSPTGQTGPNALYGDFLGGSGEPLPAPNVKPGVRRPTVTPAQNVFQTSGLAGAPLQDPGNNLVNPGYGEQALQYTQNRLLQDPSAQLLQNQYSQANRGTTGGSYLNQNLGTLNGPGQGDQYWNQVSGQFNDPFVGEQFTRQATQDFSPTGAAGAFYNQAQGQYGQFTGYTGPQNAQGQYGQSASSLAGGSAGEQGLGQIAGQYATQGQYGGPNLASGQYAQTQGAFGDLPIANFDPFYDRARQLGVQSYNQDAAGRGVYGSSEALSGVGNVITDIEAQRANRSFDAEMQRAQEQRARQELLGNQARMGDLSSMEGFRTNLAGAETFGRLNQAQGQLELQRNELLGNMANQADAQALGAQQANLAGLNAFGNLAGQADTAETNRFQARTGAMNQADQTGLNRLTAGADISQGVDAGNRADYQAETSAAGLAGNLQQNQTRLGADIAQTLSQNDLSRLNAFNNTAQGAEQQRQGRVQSRVTAQTNMTNQMLNSIGADLSSLVGLSQADFENKWQSDMVPLLQEKGYSDEQIKEAYSLAQSLIGKM